VRILFASSETIPFAKTGGLADVAGTLPTALAQNGHEVFFILPKYRQVDENRFHLTKEGWVLKVPIFQKRETAEV